MMAGFPRPAVGPYPFRWHRTVAELDAGTPIRRDPYRRFGGQLVQLVKSERGTPGAMVFVAVDDAVVGGAP